MPTPLSWLAKETGKSYRLPSEAEQEYLLRGEPGDSTGKTLPIWPWGNDGNAGCAAANVADVTAKAVYASWVVSSCSDGFVTTAPVGSLAKNDFGLSDMSGNVWEWAEDCWNESHSGAPADGSARRGGDCSFRFVRGGSWGYKPVVLRASFRNWGGVTGRDISIGFRLIQDL